MVKAKLTVLTFVLFTTVSLNISPILEYVGTESTYYLYSRLSFYLATFVVF